MNKDQAKGGMKTMAGKTQQQAGKLTGNKEQEAKGIGKQVAGKVQQAAGDVKQAVGKARKDH
jgi:uncharacterized protein YjbJ (UPF0337 family)